MVSNLTDIAIDNECMGDFTGIISALTGATGIDSFIEPVIKEVTTFASRAGDSVRQIP